MIPVTRALTSTSLEPSVCPTYSKATGKLCGAITCTVTSAGGNPPKPACCCDCPQAARALARASAAAKRELEKAVRMIDSLVLKRAGYCGATCG